MSFVILSHFWGMKIFEGVANLLSHPVYLYLIHTYTLDFNTEIFISESQTIEDFGETLHLDRSDVEHLRSVFLAVENGDIGMLKSLGIKDSELGDVKFFLEKLVNTGFLD